MSINRKPLRTVINSTDFSGVALPTDWVQSGGFTVNGGLISPALGGWDVVAYWNKYSTLENAILEMDIQINDITSVFRIFRKNTVSGSICEIDCGNKLLKIYALWDGGTTPPVLVTSKAIPFDFVDGRTYTVKLRKKINVNIFYLIDTVTDDKVTLATDNAINTFIGGQCGFPGIMFQSGDIKVTRSDFIANIPSDPKVAIYGDSIVEGNTLSTYMDNYRNRWAYKIYMAIEKDCLISGKGGESSTGLLTKLDVDLDYFTPDYVIVLIGANDSVYATWLANIQAIIAKIVARGAIPILCTITPYAAVQTFINQANTWIMASEYDYIDMAYAVSNNNDRVTWGSGMAMVDNIHPSVAGHLAMYNQCLTDLPEIFA